MQSSTDMTGNYLSPEYQIQGIERLNAKVTKKLLAYIKSKHDVVNENLRLHEIKGDLDSCTKKQCVVALYNEFKDMTSQTLLKIQEEKHHDNRNLLRYLKVVAGLFSIAEEIMTTYEKAHNKSSFFKKSNLHGFFGEETKLCKDLAQFLEQAVDINIYAVTIPLTEYKKIYGESKTFHYEGRTTAVAKSLGGGATAIAAAGATVFFSPVIIAIELALTQGELLKGIGGIIAGAAETGKEGITRYGYGCKIDLPPEWIQGRVKKDNNQINIEENSSYVKNTSQTQLVYMLDCRNPKEIYELGTNYFLDEKSINPHGHVIFFHNIKDALLCAQARTDGFTYDNIGGWRLNNPWTEKERHELRDASKLIQAIENQNVLSKDLVNIVVEYVSPMPRKLK